MLTALVETQDRIAGLARRARQTTSSLASFDVEEVFARLRALLRRTSPVGALTGVPKPPPAPEGQLEAAGLRMDVQARRAWRRTRELELTRTEFELLELLVRNAGIVLDHSTIYDRIWGYDFGPGSRKPPCTSAGQLRASSTEPRVRPS
ncbi:DNA-binding response regulator OS=Streptomyces alboniger OX=132473 GN=CP975_16430 PE=4 SV=1 [Streptomyces alboniger]